MHSPIHLRPAEFSFFCANAEPLDRWIPRVFHSEMDPSNHTKITNSEARSLSLMMRKACRRNKTAAHCLSNNSLIKAIMELRYLKAKNSKIALLRKQKQSRRKPESSLPFRFALTYAGFVERSSRPELDSNLWTRKKRRLLLRFILHQEFNLTCHLKTK